MVNTGRRSGACYSCKRMKVRCSEDKPCCYRCLAANRTCPGYPPTPDVFRTATVASKGQFPDVVHHRRSGLAGIDFTKTAASADFTIVHRAVLPDWEACGVSMFIHHYVLPDTDPIYWGHMGSLPDFYRANENCVYLRHAMLAVSHALLAHDAKSETLLIKAREHRACAFHDLRLSLEDKQQATSDQVLLSLFLLERFELFSAENNSAKVWYNHSEGFSALLRLRGEAQLHSAIGRDLFRWINVHLSIRDHFYGTKLAYPGPIPDSLKPPAAIRQGYAMQRMGGLIERLKAIQEVQGQEAETLVAMIDEILASATEIREYLEGWLPELPVPIRASVAPTASRSEPPCSPALDMPYRNGRLHTPSLYCFHSFTEGSAFNFYWIIWIRWARFFIDCYRHRSWLASLPPLSTASSTNVRLMPAPVPAVNPYTIPSNLPPGILPLLFHASSQATRTIPFMTGEVRLLHPTNSDGHYTIVDAHSLPADYTPPRGCAFGCWASLWHLNNIVSTPEIDSGHPGLRAWAMERLLDLRDRVGIKQAGAFYELFMARMAEGRALRNLFRFEQEQQQDRQSLQAKVDCLELPS